MSEGYKYVMDLDLPKFFDTVDHEIFMGLVGKHIRRLIFVFPKARVIQQGNWEETEIRIPRTALEPLAGERLSDAVRQGDKKEKARGSSMR